MKTIEIIHKPTDEEPFLVINKPHGLPSAPIKEDDKENALMKAAEFYPELLLVKGKKEIEHGLIHRLDTVTDGLLVIATTQDSYEKLIKLQNDGKIIKTYTAVCDISESNPSEIEGFPDRPLTNLDKAFSVKSYFRAFGPGSKEVRPVTESSGKAALKKLKNPVLYKTEIKIIEKTKDKAVCECKIEKGYRHQVRCHLAWAGYPVKNDFVYNAKCRNRENSSEVLFSATKISIDGLEFSL